MFSRNDTDQKQMIVFLST